jgi:GNAT superfamily N-acetyltransferase
MKQIKYKLYKIKVSLKEKRFKDVFSNPINIFYLLVLITRSFLFRLVPRVIKMFFIRKDFSDFQIETSITEYEFKIFSHYSEEINTYVLTRGSEDPNSIFEAYSKVIADRLNNGLKAFALLHHGVIVSIFFTSEQDSFVEQVNYTYKPEKNEISILDIYTLSNYRKKGLYSLLLKHSIKYYRRVGINTFVMWIMKHNRATIQAQLKNGFTNIFRIVSLFCWLGIEKSSIETSEKPLNTL